MDAKSYTETINGHSFEMLYIQGGSFMMGDGKYNDTTLHKVVLSDYWLGKYPSTQSLWKTVMGENPAHFKGDKLPVEQVSWEDTQLFLEKLNTLSKYTYTLPSEAQWEYAARGGIYKEDHKYTYSGSDEIEEVAWYGNFKGTEHNYASTMPPGLKAVNALGLYDMSGNVYEWCQDIYDNNFYKNKSVPKLNPINNTPTLKRRVLRGGSWSYFDFNCRVSSRFDHDLALRRNSLGFRLSRAS